MKKKISTIVIILVTLILAGVAIFTAIRLYQLRRQPVAPTAPESEPQAAVSQCTSLSFTITAGTATATATGTSQATATATGTSQATATATGTSQATATPTPTDIGGEPNACGGTCGSNFNCAEGLFCYQGFCRNPDCASDTDCTCAVGGAGPTDTPAGTQQAGIPETGASWPTIIGIGLGILVIIGSFFLAL